MLYRIINLQMEGSSGGPGPETGKSIMSSIEYRNSLIVWADTLLTMIQTPCIKSGILRSGAIVSEKS